jgi:hypothetical protein
MTRLPRRYEIFVIVLNAAASLPVHNVYVKGERGCSRTAGEMSAHNSQSITHFLSQLFVFDLEVLEP